MKRKISAAVALILSMQLIITSAFAATTQNNTSAEIQRDLIAAEEILDGPCKLAATETKVVGNYIVENRFYVLENSETRSSSGKTGGVSSQVWRDFTSSTWNIKVLFAAFFYYNGTTAICIPEESDIWATDASREELNVNLNPNFTYKDGETAKASCHYAISIGGIPSISNTIRVTCSAAGEVGFVSEEEHVY